MTQYLFRCGLRAFFKRPANGVEMSRFDDLQFHHFVGQQTDAPARVPGGRLGTGQGDQPRLSLAVEDRLDRRMHPLLAGQYRRHPLFHQLPAHLDGHG